MKNVYHKAKGKIHPSPAAPPPPDAGAGLSSSKHDALEVLNVLPAAILVLTTALTSGDKEVLAYLVTRSLHGPAAATAPAERKRGPGAAHRPLLDCGCFDCYTSFWSRWDASPDRELIHQAIEAFEEHLASAEKRGAGRGARRRERRRMDRAEKVKERAEAAAVVAEEKKNIVEEPKTVTEAPTGEETCKERSGGEGESVAAGGEKRRRWADVKELFDSVFWNLWGPAV